jgi:HD-GYP domain-containing protein (c-di-GMP phosphodiesterase class II)
MPEHRCNVDRTSAEISVWVDVSPRQTYFSQILNRTGFRKVTFHPEQPNALRDTSHHSADLVIFSVNAAAESSWTSLKEVRDEFSGPILATAEDYDDLTLQRLAAMGVNDLLRLRECSDEALAIKMETVLLASQGEKTIADNDHRNQSLFINILTVMVKILDSKDHYTRWHSHNVAIRSRKLGRKLGLSEDELDRLGLAAVFHDFGKIGIPESILNKPSGLTKDEFDFMKRHPVIARDLLSSLDLVRDLLPAIQHHHERWDGNGYPDGLAGERIPLWARIIALADSYDTMSSRRAYKQAFDRGFVVDEIQQCAGKQFDPRLVPFFLEIIKEEDYRPHPGYRNNDKPNPTPTPTPTPA